MLVGLHNRNLLLPFKTLSMGELARSHCLLLAIVLSICYKAIPKWDRLENVRFQRLEKGRGAAAVRRRNVMILELLLMMRRAGINYPLRERIYTVDRHLPMVQRFLDRCHPRQYRISVFGSRGRMRPIWKGKRRARHELCLYLRDKHFYGVRRVDSLFGASYCMDCESTYSDRRTHRANCVAKCARCCGMGLEFPCKEEPNYYQECAHCHNQFRNSLCYQRHLEKRICQLFKR